MRLSQKHLVIMGSLSLKDIKFAKLLRAYQLRSNGVIFLVKCTVSFSLQQYVSVG